MASVKSQRTGTAQSNLSKQDLSTLNVGELTPLSPEVISRQATINIGTIGHVAHGKSTVVKAVSGVQTVRFKNELERNITIKLETNGANDKSSKKRKRSIESDRKRLKMAKTEEPDPGEKGNESAAEFEVEEILNHLENYGKVSKYQVKWKGWPVEESTWEPFENLRGCLETVVKYFDNLIFKLREERVVFKVSSKFIGLKKSLSIFSREEMEDASRRYFTEDGDNIPEVDVEKLDYELHVLARLPPVARDYNFVKEIRDSLLWLKLKKKRRKQMEELKMWETEINEVYGGRSPPIKVVNSVDLEDPPSGLIYIDKYLAGKGVEIPDDPLYGCECTSTCYRKRCVEDHGGEKAYNKEGLLRVKRGTPIYECNKKCPCPPDCENRLIQKGRQVPLCIFKTNNGCGWGVKAMAPIPKGTFVCQYVGEVITTEEAERRGKTYDRQGSTYLFDLDFADRDNFPFTVDAKVYGNVSHFINHSCQPNLEVYAIWVDCMDPNMPNLCLFACRNIKAGEELSFDYLCQPLDCARSYHALPTTTQTMCKCGSQNCRKYLF